MAIWKWQPSLDELNTTGKDSMQGFLGIEFTEIGDDYLKAKMPVTSRVKQVYGILHGGASVTLAETIGSVAGMLCVDYPAQGVVGMEINANHLKPVRGGVVTATAKPLHLGSSTQVWDIKITDDKDDLVCVSRLTLAIIQMRTMKIMGP